MNRLELEESSINFEFQFLIEVFTDDMYNLVYFCCIFATNLI